MNQALLNTLRACAADAPEEIAAVYLFGSVARGEEGGGSDVDVGVLFGGRAPQTLVNAATRFADSCERAIRRPVDVVVLDTAPPDLVHRVLQAGCLILDRRPSERIRFEVRSRAEYFDLAPLRTLYRREPARSGDRP